MLCNAILYYTILYYTILYCTILYSTILYHTIYLQINYSFILSSVQVSYMLLYFCGRHIGIRIVAVIVQNYHLSVLTYICCFIYS